MTVFVVVEVIESLLVSLHVLRVERELGLLILLGLRLKKMKIVHIKEREGLNMLDFFHSLVPFYTFLNKYLYHFEIENNF